MNAGMRAGAAVAVLAGVVIAFLPAPDGVAREVLVAGGLTVATVGVLATQALPEHVAALAFLAIAAAFRIAPPDVVFGGVHTSVIWLMLSGVVIGAAMRETGLDAALAARVLGRRAVDFRSAALWLLLLSLALSFVMPATMARVVVLVPIALAVADRLRHAEGSRGRHGLVIAVVFGSLMPSYAILPANLPNVVILGAAEALYGARFTYVEYLGWLFPVVGVLKSIVLYALIVHRFGDRAIGLEAAPAGPSSPIAPRRPERARALAWILAAVVLGWMTDFVHHVAPGWIALVAAVIVLVPAFGFLPREAFGREIGLAPFFYLAGVLGIGAVAAHTGLGEILARAFAAEVGLAPGATARNYAALVALAMLLVQTMTSPAAAAVCASLAGELAQATGLPVKTVLMAELFGMSTVVFPYVAPPLVVGLALGRVPAGEAARFTFTLAVITVVVLAPVNFALWEWTGIGR
jgi:di/tricarboxylate transporter